MHKFPQDRETSERQMPAERHHGKVDIGKYSLCRSVVTNTILVLTGAGMQMSFYLTEAHLVCTYM